VVGEDNRKQVMLAEACQAFIDDTRLLKRPKTYSQYKTALEYFQESCLDKPLSSVDRTDLTRFMGFLAEQKQLESRTIWNKVQVVISMLKANGITRLLRQRDWPRYTESTPEVFTAEEVRTFLFQCEGERRTAFEFFWMTGFREQEVQYVTCEPDGTPKRCTAQMCRSLGEKNGGIYLGKGPSSGKHQGP
jgi:hypothetical protein